MKRSLPLLAVAAAIAVLLTLPFTAFAQSHHRAGSACHKKPVIRHVAPTASGPVFTFGSQGGNMVPWSVTFNADGSVTKTGWVKPNNARLADPTNALNALLNLASNEGFFSMPAMTSCTGTNPDVAARYVIVYTGSSSRQVKVHGGCVRSFSELFAALENTADFQH